jgi:hypothetical protein
VRRVLPEYLGHLTVVARDVTRYQTTAAELASQGHQLAYLLELQGQNFRLAESHVLQAIQYAQLAGDRNLLVSALIRKANLSFTRGWAVQTLQAYQDAMRQSDENVSPLLIGQMYSGLAEAHAHVDREQNQQAGK